MDRHGTNKKRHKKTVSKGISDFPGILIRPFDQYSKKRQKALMAKNQAVFRKEKRKLNENYMLSAKHGRTVEKFLNVPQNAHGKLSGSCSKYSQVGGASCGARV